MSSESVYAEGHACAGCDALLGADDCGGAVLGFNGPLGPVCRRCFADAMQSHDFGDLVRRAVTLGHTLPAVRQQFAQCGLDLPVSHAECQRAAAVLHGMDALEAMQPAEVHQ